MKRFNFITMLLSVIFSVSSMFAAEALLEDNFDSYSSQDQLLSAWPIKDKGDECSGPMTIVSGLNGSGKAVQARWISNNHGPCLGKDFSNSSKIVTFKAWVRQDAAGRGASFSIRTSGGSPLTFICCGGKRSSGYFDIQQRPSQVWAHTEKIQVGKEYHLQALINTGSGTMDFFVDGKKFGPYSIGKGTFARLGVFWNYGGGTTTIDEIQITAGDDISDVPTATIRTKGLQRNENMRVSYRAINNAAVFSLQGRIISAAYGELNSKKTGLIVIKNIHGKLRSKAMQF